jgi:hypothetical protein
MLTGFTYFPNNRANYLATDGSLPSMFTSSFFSGGAFRDFQARARDGGIRRALQRHGYMVSTYTPDQNRFWWFASRDAAITAQDVTRAEADPDGAKLLMQTSLIRASPAGMRLAMLWLTRLAMPWTVYNRYKQDPRLLDRFLADEAQRPDHGQYVYFHIMLPHPPYRHGADCSDVGKDRGSYTSQAACAALMMRRVMARLNALGRLKRSMVIFHGDHGFHAKESNLPAEHAQMPAAIRRKLDSMRDSFDADDMLQRSRALLLVKPASSDAAPLVTSAAATQLIDIAPTIAETGGFHFVGLGRPIFALDANAPRAWHFFAGLTRKHGLFRKRLGRDTEAGALAHISLDPAGNWHIHPDITAGEPSGHPAR